MAWLVGAIGQFLLGGLLSIVGSLVGRVIAGAGMGVVAYTGISTTIGWLKQQIISGFHSLPSDVLAVLGLLRVGSIVSMLCSALIVRMTLKGLQSDTVKAWVKK